MKNRLTDSIYKAWRTGILPLVTTLLLLTGCEMDSAMDLPLNVDSNKYTLTADAGSTQVRIYSTGEWSARLSEDVDWATIDRLGGEGNGWITFKYAANYGVPRTVDILFNRGGGEQVIRMTQEGKDFLPCHFSPGCGVLSSSICRSRLAATLSGCVLRW